MRSPNARKKRILVTLIYEHPKKNENTSRRGLTYTEILKRGPRNIRKTFERTNDANLFSSPSSPPSLSLSLPYLLFFSYSPSLRVKAQIILGASCCNTLIQSQESRLLRQNRSLISTLRPCDSVMKIERGTYIFVEKIQGVSEASPLATVYHNFNRVILFSLMMCYTASNK